MTVEFRLTIIRPPSHTDGRSEYYYNKRDIEHARKGLVDHYANEERVQAIWHTEPYSIWHARIDTRTITDWSETI